MTVYGFRNNTLKVNDLTVDNDLTIEGNLTFGDATTDTLTVNGLFVLAGDVSASQMEVTGTWGLGFNEAAINIGGTAAIAFGSVADSICMIRSSITAQMGAADKYVIGEYKTYATSGAGAGTVLQHGIWIGDYTKINISHNTTDCYATRGRVVIDGAIAGNQFTGMMAMTEVTAAATLEATGGVYGIVAGVAVSGSGTVNRQAAAVYASMRDNTVDIAGEASCIVADMGGSGYADYGLIARCGNNNLGEALVGLMSSDSAVVPSGIKFSRKDGTGTITNAFEFETSGIAPHSALTVDTDGGNSNSCIVIDVAGSTKYIPVFDTAT